MVGPPTKSTDLKTFHESTNTHSHGKAFFTTTVMVNRPPIKFIIDGGSPVTLVQKVKLNNITLMCPTPTEYRQINNNRFKLEGKTKAIKDFWVINTNPNFNNKIYHFLTRIWPGITLTRKKSIRKARDKRTWKSQYFHGNQTINKIEVNIVFQKEFQI